MNLYQTGVHGGRKRGPSELCVDREKWPALFSNRRGRLSQLSQESIISPSWLQENWGENSEIRAALKEADDLMETDGEIQSFLFVKQLESGRLQQNQQISLLDELLKCWVSNMAQLNSLKKWNNQHEKAYPLVMGKYRGTTFIWLNVTNRWKRATLRLLWSCWWVLVLSSSAGTTGRPSFRSELQSICNLSHCYSERFRNRIIKLKTLQHCI